MHIHTSSRKRKWENKYYFLENFSSPKLLGQSWLIVEFHSNSMKCLPWDIGQRTICKQRPNSGPNVNCSTIRIIRRSPRKLFLVDRTTLQIRGPLLAYCCHYKPYCFPMVPTGCQPWANRVCYLGIERSIYLNICKFIELLLELLSKWVTKIQWKDFSSTSTTTTKKKLYNTQSNKFH